MSHKTEASEQGRLEDKTMHLGAMGNFHDESSSGEETTLVIEGNSAKVTL